MITKYKIFESINEGEPKEGDYVIINSLNPRLNTEYPDVYQFLLNTIGKIQHIEVIKNKYLTHKNIQKNDYYVHYDIPASMRPFFYSSSFKGYDVKEDQEKGEYYKVFRKGEIQYWSKNKKDLQMFVDAKKYNL